MTTPDSSETPQPSRARLSAFLGGWARFQSKGGDSASDAEPPAADADETGSGPDDAGADSAAEIDDAETGGDAEDAGSDGAAGSAEATAVPDDAEAEGAGAASLAGLLADSARSTRGGPCAVVCTGGNADDDELAALGSPSSRIRGTGRTALAGSPARQPVDDPRQLVGPRVQGAA